MWRDDIRDVKSTRVMRGATCGTDHMMVRAECNLRIAPIRRKRARQPFGTRDVGLLPQKAEELEKKVSGCINPLQHPDTEEMSLNERWSQISSVVYAATKEVLGHPRWRHADLFDQNNVNIVKLIDEVRLCRRRSCLECAQYG